MEWACAPTHRYVLTAIRYSTHISHNNKHIFTAIVYSHTSVIVTCAHSPHHTTNVDKLTGSTCLTELTYSTHTPMCTHTHKSHNKHIYLTYRHAHRQYLSHGVDMLTSLSPTPLNKSSINGAFLIPHVIASCHSTFDHADPH